MDAAEFSFETLSKQEAIERKQPRLTKLEPTFWEALRGYLDRLSQTLRVEQQRNPSARKISLLQDELRNATRKAEALWESRERKITLHGLKNSRTPGAPPPEGILKAEQALYEELVASFRRHAPRLNPEDEAPAAPPRPSAPAPPREPAPEPKPAAPARGGEDLVTVRALADVPSFVGLDGKTYRLRKGDVLTLPRKMVDILAKRGQVALVA